MKVPGDTAIPLEKASVRADLHTRTKAGKANNRTARILIIFCPPTMQAHAITSCTWLQFIFRVITQGFNYLTRYFHAIADNLFKILKCFKTVYDSTTAIPFSK